jgi:hypothetical protein
VEPIDLEEAFYPSANLSLVQIRSLNFVLTAKNRRTKGLFRMPECQNARKGR